MAGLADDWEKNRQTCVDVLCANLRMPYKPDPGDEAPVPEHLAFRASREVRHAVIRVITAHLQEETAVSWHGLDLDFKGVVFDGGYFSGAEFSAGTVHLPSAEFCRGEVDFSDVLNWSVRPEFPWTGMPPSGVMLPREGRRAPGLGCLIVSPPHASRGWLSAGLPVSGNSQGGGFWRLQGPAYLLPRVPAPTMGARYEVTSQDVTEFGGWPRPPRWVWAAGGLAVVALLLVVVVARTGPHHAAASSAARNSASSRPAPADGGACAILAPGGTVRVWNPATGRAVGAPLHASAPHGVSWVAFSPDGKLLATADGDGTVRQWNPATGPPTGGLVRSPVCLPGPISARVP